MNKDIIIDLTYKLKHYLSSIAFYQDKAAEVSKQLLEYSKKRIYNRI